MLDLKILMIIAFSIFTIATFINLTLIYYFAKNKTLKYLLGFNIGFLFGLLFMILRNSIPDFLTIIVGNTLLTTGYVFIYMAAKGLLKQETLWHFRYLIPVFVVFIGLVFFTYGYYDVGMRIVIFSLFCVIYGFALGLLFWKHAYGKFLLLYRLSALLSFASSGVFLLRAFSASTFEIPVSYFQVLVFPYIYLIVMVILLNILFSLQILHNYKLEKTFK